MVPEPKRADQIVLDATGGQAVPPAELASSGRCFSRNQDLRRHGLSWVAGASIEIVRP